VPFGFGVSGPAKTRLGSALIMWSLASVSLPVPTMLRPSAMIVPEI